MIYFNHDESIDYESLKKHVLHVVKGGVDGLVLQGSNGEAPHLLHSERQQIVSVVRKYLGEIGHPKMPLIVGCGASSVRETLLHITEAKEAGADYALVLPPSYWVSLMTAAGQESFFSDVSHVAYFMGG